MCQRNNICKIISLLAVVGLLTHCSQKIFDSLDKQQTSTDTTINAFTQAIILDGKALTQTYQRFFATEKRIFNAEEMRQLGTISYADKNQFFLNGYRYHNIDQAYIKVLRVALARLCKEKVRAEIEIAASDPDTQFAAHKLVKHFKIPTRDNVSLIMDEMFGYRLATGNIQRGANEYANVFSKNMQENEQNSQKLADNYTLLCMSIGQDARVFIR